MEYTYEYLDQNFNYSALRYELLRIGGTPGVKNREQLIKEIIGIRKGEIIPVRSKRGRPRNGSKINQPNYFPQRATVKTCDHQTDFQFDKQVTGILDFDSDGSAFLRTNGFFPTKTDISVSDMVVKAYDLLRGDLVTGTMELRAGYRSYELITIMKINGHDPSQERIDINQFDPIYPNELFNLYTEDETLKAIDTIAPIGKGQRAIIVSSQGVDNKLVLKKIANSISIKYPSVEVMSLFIDEQPEEIYLHKKTIKGEVIASSFDVEAKENVRLAELVTSRCKRMLEDGKDIVLLIDSLSKLVRSSANFNAEKNKTTYGGISPNSLVFAKKIMSLARNTEHGSITILAVVEDGSISQIDEIIFEELHDMGNAEIVLKEAFLDSVPTIMVDAERSYNKCIENFADNDRLFCQAKIKSLVKNGKTNDEAMKLICESDSIHDLKLKLENS